DCQNDGIPVKIYCQKTGFRPALLGKICRKSLVCLGALFWHSACLYRGVMSGHSVSLEYLVTRFQVASESLERSYRELQGRVQSLTAELEREREERIRLERLAAMG